MEIPIITQLSNGATTQYVPYFTAPLEYTSRKQKYILYLKEARNPLFWLFFNVFVHRRYMWDRFQFFVQFSNHKLSLRFRS